MKKLDIIVLVELKKVFGHFFGNKSDDRLELESFQKGEVLLDGERRSIHAC